MDYGIPTWIFLIFAPVISSGVVMEASVGSTLIISIGMALGVSVGDPLCNLMVMFLDLSLVNSYGTWDLFFKSCLEHWLG